MTNDTFDSFWYLFRFLLTCVACAPSEFSILCSLPLRFRNVKKNSKHARHDGLPVWHKKASADSGREERVLTFSTCSCGNARYVGLLGGWTRFLWHKVARAKKVQWRYCFRALKRLTWSKRKIRNSRFFATRNALSFIVNILIIGRYSGNVILQKKCENRPRKTPRSCL